MEKPWLRITYIGGPTAVLELEGLRILTDPTFDPAGTEYRLPLYTLRKTAGPALSAKEIGSLDAVLLSHDHHFDNFDHQGRAMLSQVSRVFTTPAGAARLGSAAVGLEPWQTVELARQNRTVRIAGTPCRHGPANGDRGPVSGFFLTVDGRHKHTIYVSGDTVWYEGIAEIARRLPPSVALLFMGAARLPKLGPHHLTFTSEEGVHAARSFVGATVIPLHFEGWAHYSETRTDIEEAFGRAELAHRLRLWRPGETLEFMD